VGSWVVLYTTVEEGYNLTIWPNLSQLQIFQHFNPIFVVGRVSLREIFHKDEKKFLQESTLQHCLEQQKIEFLCNQRHPKYSLGSEKLNVSPYIHGFQ
jgi:hypothetical protein